MAARVRIRVREQSFHAIVDRGVERRLEPEFLLQVFTIRQADGVFLVSISFKDPDRKAV